MLIFENLYFGIGFSDRFNAFGKIEGLNQDYSEKIGTWKNVPIVSFHFHCKKYKSIFLIFDFFTSLSQLKNASIALKLSLVQNMVLEISLFEKKMFKVNF